MVSLTHPLAVTALRTQNAEPMTKTKDPLLAYMPELARVEIPLTLDRYSYRTITEMLRGLAAAIDWAAAKTAESERGERYRLDIWHECRALNRRLHDMKRSARPVDGDAEK